jgi:hypothetical protein
MRIDFGQLRIHEGKNEKSAKFHVFEMLGACPFLRAEGFSCCLNVLHGGLGIKNIAMFDLKS